MCNISFCFFNETATTEIYTLSLHDALPISQMVGKPSEARNLFFTWTASRGGSERGRFSGLTLRRSEEHTSELQSRRDLVCRLLLEKKKQQSITHDMTYRGALFPHWAIDLGS